MPEFRLIQLRHTETLGQAGIDLASLLPAAPS